MVKNRLLERLTRLLLKLFYLKPQYGNIQNFRTPSIRISLRANSELLIKYYNMLVRFCGEGEILFFFLLFAGFLSDYCSILFSFCLSKNSTERFFLVVLDKCLENRPQSVLEKVDLLVMTKHAAERDRNLKSGQFDTRYLEMFGESEKVAHELVMVALRHLVQISNSNIVRNADSLITKMDTDPDVKWIGKSDIKVDKTKCKTSY